MQLTVRDQILDLNHPRVMGILNVTPDSFSDGGRHNSLNDALLHAHALISAGATMIDVGASPRARALPRSVKRKRLSALCR